MFYRKKRDKFIQPMRKRKQPPPKKPSYQDKVTTLLQKLEQCQDDNESFECIFCEEDQNANFFHEMIMEALYNKYSQSQNFYYAKDINDFIDNNPTSSNITYKEQCFQDDEEEYLQRFYMNWEHEERIVLLTEYYKFHEDVPRTFLKRLTEILSWYHDQKRTMKYNEYKALMGKEQK